ncbi:hypothetical protein H0R92_07460 [Treponema sp. OMZ 840]|uniref:hypothetical protein n=1 Tax=Treponema sp. OMZ 840 TaxID=244313 RepID=UPI003D950AB9
MKSKIKTILLTILIFSLLECIVYIGYSIWDIRDGFSGKRSLTEQEISDISSTLSNYFNNQESKPIKWEICSAYFAEAIYDDPVSNQYNVNVDCFYENEKKNYRFTLLKGLKKYHIDTVQELYIYLDEK